MNHKQHLGLSIKSVEADGFFTGSLAVYNNIDLGGDLIEPGAFTKTIQEHGDTVPLLWQHDPSEPIGMLTLIDGPQALSVKGRLNLELQTAQKAYILLKSRIVTGLSIGFDCVKDAMDGGVRKLKELRLWEGSIVTFPMNTAAQVLSVKARKAAGEDFDTEYAELLLQDASYQMWIALRNSLGMIPWASDLTRDEKLAAAQVCIDQFGAAYMDMLPAYIDWLAEEYGSMGYMSRQKKLETKEGRRLSAATADQLAKASAHVKACAESNKNAGEILVALLGTEADVDDDADATSGEKAAIIPQSEPVHDHSAAQSLVESIRSLIRAA